MYADIKVILLLICMSAQLIHMYEVAVNNDEDDDAYISKYMKENLQKAFDKGGATAAKLLLSHKLDEWKQFKINIGVTGSSGVGKSSLVNALRGLTAEDDGAAAVGVVETTKEPKSYQHPNNENLLLWDLPGVGTPTFLRNKYLDKIGFLKYDHFIIMSSGRFTENDLWLARELKKNKKRFYFVRSKIAQDVENDRKSYPKSHDQNTVLDQIRTDCMKNLQEYAKDVYLIDTFETDKYDFNDLSYKILIDAPELKREAILFTFNRYSEDLILAKKEAMLERIHYVAVTSAIAGAIPLPGLDVAVDLAALVEEAIFYQQQFGLTDEALERYAERIGTSAEDLTGTLGLKTKIIQFTSKGLAVYMSKLGAKKMARYTSKRILKYVLPGRGSIVVAAAAYTLCFYTLEDLLELFVQDALIITRHNNYS